MTNKKMAIISPATFTVDYDKEKVRLALAEFGFEPVYGAHAFEHDRFAAGPDMHRAADIMWAFQDASIDAVMSLRGGYGTPRLLDKLDYDCIRAHKKPFFGFSDLTALQMALWHKAGLVSYSGIQASFMEKPLHEAMSALFKTYLAQEPVTFEGMTPVTKGKSCGTLMGGTLTLISSLIGTPYLPSLKGALLVIEEVGEDPYRVDRMLTQLRLAGVFDQVNGIILAGFYNCVSKDPLDGTIEQVLTDQFADATVPVIKDFRYGHGINEIIFPIGATADLDATKGVLTIDEYNATDRIIGTGGRSSSGVCRTVLRSGCGVSGATEIFRTRGGR